MNSPKQSSDKRNTASGQSANRSAGHDGSSQNLKVNIFFDFLSIKNFTGKKTNAEIFTGLLA